MLRVITCDVLNKNLKCSRELLCNRQENKESYLGIYSRLWWLTILPGPIPLTLARIDLIPAFIINCKEKSIEYKQRKIIYGISEFPENKENIYIQHYASFRKKIKNHIDDIIK